MGEPIMSKRNVVSYRSKITSSSAVQATSRDLKFLSTLSVPVVAEFVSISLRFIGSGPNQKLYSGAAGKLGLDVDMVKRGVDAIVQLFTTSARLKLSPKEFTTVLHDVGIPSEHLPSFQKG